ncbi:hypothetical protein [Cryobacterium sp. GrIS_2_6]|uniref:hypothetical protein n=1 Tax=Cryobacterium sp. GrIS_2_6 TaxID=3162785 RepID=UPI002E05694C|nr:hypothetical protein [Cryobacterium psychrotolerans]
MTRGTPAIEATPPKSETPAATAPAPIRHRDAGNTRQYLLQAARPRFAYYGYAATTRKP